MKETLEKIKGKIRLDSRYVLPGIVVGALLVIILIWALVARVFIPGNRYNGAQALLAAGKYQQAAEGFTALGSYRDAADRAKECRYAYAEELLSQGLYTEATAQFKQLGDYSDAKARIQDVRYAAADELLPTLEEAFRQDVPALIECPIDYAENGKLTRHLKEVYAHLE